MKRKLVALTILFFLPILVTAPTGSAIQVEWAYGFAKMGMSDEEMWVWAAGMTVMCGMAFIPTAAIGCGIAATF